MSPPPNGWLVGYVRLRRIRHKVNALDVQDVLIVGFGAQLEGRVSWNLEVLVDGDLIVATKVQAKARMGDTGRERDKCT